MPISSKFNKFLFFLILISSLIFIFNIIPKNNAKEKANNHINSDNSLVSKKENWGYKDTIVKRTLSNNKIKIAILDSGINKEHPDLKGRIHKEFNAISPEEPVKDKFNHGTPIAGIIAAKDDSNGIKGISPKSEIYSVKVLNDKGEGSVDHIIKGIEWAINEKVEIINISFGFKNHNKKLKKIVNKATSNGIIIVASSGNNYINDVDYPAKYNNVISVGSIDQEHERVKFSPRGKIDVVGPGRDILSTNNLNDFSIFEGTSFSTAYVTGLISLYLSEKPTIKFDQKAIIKLLKNQSLDLGIKGKDNTYGYGLLQYK
ncbi:MULTISPECIES: S8 family peptidase [unclassified Bacillus (in: firmicutes)]|uniref:S8 family peptidase n=1 Tax=unclassified Bacillus (in: firmicutes) TaxID=185979 RepID=UPI00288BFFF3|nr:MULTISPECIES: S8 family peptidase [unclassified Bacillus (in: firmicutes)]